MSRSRAKAPEFSRRRAIAILVVAAALCVVIGNEAAARVRPDLANRYVERGKSYLKSEQYDAAAREFRSAERLDAGSAAQWVQLAEDAPTNPRILTEYWREEEVVPLVARVEAATLPYDSPKEAVAAAITLYAAGYPEFAQYALDRALELDPAYPEAWHYRYLVYDKMAEKRAVYRQKADEARQKRDELTSLYLKP
jgi:tetratricopeptide (TPR) repeat protein